MFGLVSEKKYIEVVKEKEVLIECVANQENMFNFYINKIRECKKENGKQAIIISKQDAIIADLEHNEECDNAKINGLKHDLAIERTKNAALELKSDKDKIIKEVREKLLEEIKQDKEDFAWDRFAMIGVERFREADIVNYEKSFYILQYDLIEKILRSFETSVIEKIKEVDAEW